MDQTTQTNPPTGGLPALPQFPSGQEVYDALMGSIEPELTSSQLPLLDQKYANETAGEKQQRQARYDAAFAQYEKRFAGFSIALATHVHSFQHTAIAAAESSTRSAETDDLSTLESSMQSA